MKNGLVIIASLALLAPAYAALDDITTGNEPSFALEWTTVGVTALWFVLIAGIWLRRRGSAR